MLEKLYAQDDIKRIKNIIYDWDGVLANLNLTYFLMLREHENYRDHIWKFNGREVIGSHLAWEDLNKALPVDAEKYGALELTVTAEGPEFGKRLTNDFLNSRFFFDRPLYPGTLEVLKELKSLGVEWQGTASASHKPEEKTAMMRSKGVAVEDGGPLHVYSVRHDEVAGMYKSVKKGIISMVLEKFNLKPEETAFVDDRIYNLYDPIEMGLIPVRFMSEFTTPSTPDLAGVKHVRDIFELRDWIKEVNK
jgi:FMN phosphatase YigB (HAD superfamily)